MRAYFLFFFNLLFVLNLSAQQVKEENPEPSKWKDKLIIDGNLALQFGNYTLIGGNPQIGYKISDKVIAGAGYSYYLNSINIGGIRFNDKLHGPTAFSRVLITPNLFARAEYQNLIYVLDSASDAPPSTFNRDRLFVGGGYRQSISPRINMTAGVFLDLLDPLAQPVFRAGLEAGFVNW